jgi:hypothetical protein
MIRCKDNYYQHDQLEFNNRQSKIEAIPKSEKS